MIDQYRKIIGQDYLCLLLPVYSIYFSVLPHFCLGLHHFVIHFAGMVVLG